MDLPQDPFMKSQYVNMMLKANDMDLNTFCLSADVDRIKLETELGQSGISYDADEQQFRT